MHYTMGYGELFTAVFACSVMLWSGVHAWKQKDIGWNRHRAILRFSLAPVNIVLLLIGSISHNALFIGAFYGALILSALAILLYEWYCWRNYR